MQDAGIATKKVFVSGDMSNDRKCDAPIGRFQHTGRSLPPQTPPIPGTDRLITSSDRIETVRPMSNSRFSEATGKCSNEIGDHGDAQNHGLVSNQILDLHQSNQSENSIRIHLHPPRRGRVALQFRSRVTLQGDAVSAHQPVIISSATAHFRDRPTHHQLR
ncbi:unnamed protein product [Dovyalis caffra]|uniref:Uncharacterized protein n=1 Tax=Dovyalis caffra TaxID=77055 RepID=A0AAV1RKN7_9ROSI|nr:unnamed protein product [Dovyalis caffra]